MNRRENFFRAIAHEELQRLPVDIGGLTLTGMRPGLQRGLFDLLGWTGSPEPGNSGYDDFMLQGGLREHTLPTEHMVVLLINSSATFLLALHAGAGYVPADLELRTPAGHS